MPKKLLLISVAVILLFSMSACKKNNEQSIEIQEITAVTLNYDLNGFTYKSKKIIEPVYLKTNKNYEVNAIFPTLEDNGDYTFEGWVFSDNAEIISMETFWDFVQKNNIKTLTVYAKKVWREKITVNYYLNGFTYEGESKIDSKVLYKDTYYEFKTVLPNLSYDLDGEYGFNGWKLENGTQITSIDEIWNYIEDSKTEIITVYAIKKAQWTKPY